MPSLPNIFVHLKLIFLQLNGIWTLLFLGRTSMLIGWVELLRIPFSKSRTDFVSVDARRFSNNPKTYEMITSPPPRTADTMIKTPDAVVVSPSAKADGEGISQFVQSPRPPSSQYTNSVDYFNKDFADYEAPTFGKEADYRSPKLSFSTPRPPSAGGPLSSHAHGSFSPRAEPALSRGREGSASSYSSPPTESDSGVRPFSPGYEWDPTATHAKPSQWQDSFKR